jgi:DNA-directed RNA polymerase subunit RPC12/RpoP
MKKKTWQELEDELLRYDCPECGAEYDSDEEIRYCDSEECIDKGIRLDFLGEI